MIRRLSIAYVVLVAAALLAFKVPVSLPVSEHVRDDTEATVQRDAAAMALLLANGDEAARDSLATTIRAYERETPGTVEVLPSWRGGTRVKWSDTALVVTVPASSPMQYGSATRPARSTRKYGRSGQCEPCSRSGSSQWRPCWVPLRCVG